jgi:hypothetical protein
MTKNAITIVNVPKATIAFVALVCVTVLGALDVLESDAVLAIISSVVGYAIGNGVAARSGQAVEPILGTRQNDD